MPKAAKQLPSLTDEQRALIESRYYEPPEVLLKLIWPDEEHDQRSVHWKSIRMVLASIDKAPKRGEVGSGGQRALSIPSTTGALTSEQEAFVKASYKDANGPVELARVVFADERIMSNDPRARMVLAYIRKIDSSYRREDEPVDEMDYQPPRTSAILIGRLNRFGIALRPDGKKLGDGGITGQEQRQLDALMIHMRKSVFKVEADKFTKKIDRDVFEETFMSTCWGKPDLSPEHVLQFIQLASLSAQRNIAYRMERTLDDRFMLSLEDPSQRLGKVEVEALKELKDKSSEHLKQINTLIKTLVDERKKINDKQAAGASSMHPIVQAWKERESRQRMMDLAKKYNEELKGEVTRLAGMDALRAEIYGLNPHTILQ